MNTSWSILYRGPLSSCNYACGYCPFAKTQNTREELQEDARQLRSFTDWVTSRQENIGVLFTPWGEALIHAAYQNALCELSHRANVHCVAIQTNLSCKLDWLKDAIPRTLALWCTFHPGEVDISRFVSQCRKLDAAGIGYSVGVVGTREAPPFIERLKSQLNPTVYLWVNAFKRTPDYYTTAEIELLTNADPLFPINNQRHASLGKACRTGQTVFSVDGTGDIRRCHFVKTVIGNIYQPGFEQCLRPRTCPVETCGCHIGYVHLEHLQLEHIFGPGMLPRIPQVALDRLRTAANVAPCSSS